ncbi:hypothetical protein [Microlunatus sp. Y2014]|uniref:hypothetical protein n=1 Tax=Microlunatus sp. Y2014 TaxID=3418488 RepID=UPI003DA730F4
MSSGSANPPAGPGYGGPPASAASASGPGYQQQYGMSPTTQMGPGPAGSQMGPGVPPGAPKKKSNGPMIALISSIAAVVVIAAIVAGVVLSRGAGGFGGGGPTEAVQGYFDAIVAGDAEAALGYAQVDPTDKTFLTNEVLTKSNELAPITNVVVAEVDDDYIYEVPVSFTIGERNINANIRVEEIGNDWKLQSVASEVNIEYLGIKPTINGVAATANKVFLFPGTYQFSTGNEYVTFPEGKDVITVDQPSRFSSSSISEMQPTLTEEGSAAMIAAANKSLDACLAKKELAPEGCPIQARPNLENGAIKLDMNSLKFTKEGDQFADAEPRLERENPLTATFRYYPKIKYYVTGTKNGSGVYFDARLRTTDTNIATMDFSGEEPKFSWTS